MFSQYIPIHRSRNPSPYISKSTRDPAHPNAPWSLRMNEHESRAQSWNLQKQFVNVAQDLLKSMASQNTPAHTLQLLVSKTSSESIPQSLYIRNRDHVMDSPPGVHASPSPPNGAPSHPIPSNICVQLPSLSGVIPAAAEGIGVSPVVSMCQPAGSVKFVSPSCCC